MSENRLLAALKAHVTSSRPAPGHEAALMPRGHDAAIRRRRVVEGIPLASEVREMPCVAAWRAGLDEAKLLGAAIDTV